jgi:hypothetical protein
MILVMVKCAVLFEVRTEFLYIVYMSFGFKGLMWGYIIKIADVWQSNN